MSDVSPYLLLAVSLAANLTVNTSNKLFSDRRPTPAGRSAGLSVISMVSCAVLLLWGGFRAASGFTLALGAVFGAVTFLQNLCILTAYSLGPWSYTTVLTSLSMLLPAFSGAVFWRERLNPAQLAGTALVAVCAVLSVEKKGDEKGASLKWFLWTAAAFLFCGSIGIMQKWHQSSAYAGELNEFLITAFAVGAAAAWCMTFVLYLKSKHAPSPATAPKKTPPAAFALLFLLSGAGTAAIHKLNLYLSGVLPGAVFFPLINGGALLLTGLTAFLFFRERPSKKQWVGLAAGLAAVLLLSFAG